MIKIIDNTGTTYGTIEAGEVIKGMYSGDFYLVLSGAENVLNLRSLGISKLIDVAYERTGIKRDKVTITLGGK